MFIRITQKLLPLFKEQTPNVFFSVNAHKCDRLQGTTHFP